MKFRASEGYNEFIEANLRSLEFYLSELGFIYVSDLSKQSVFCIVNHLHKNHNCMNTINKKMGLFSRALRFSDVMVDGLTNFHSIPFKRKSFQVVHEPELKKVLVHFRKLDLSKPINLTSYLVFFLFLYSGIRLNELTHIRCNEIDFDRCIIYLNHTKSSVPRIVPFKSNIRNELIKYVALKKREYLFYNFRMDHPFSNQNVESVFRYVKKVLNLQFFSPHMLRHTMATLLIENGVSIVSVQHLLGHASSKTTDIYLHMSVKRIREEYDQAFPKL